MSVRFTDKVTPDGERLMRELRELTGLEVFVGFQRGKRHKKKSGSKTRKKSPKMIDIVAWNELGTSRGIPERPFIRQTVDNHQSEIEQAKKAIVATVLKGETARRAAASFGAWAVDLMANEIDTGGFAENADITKALKESSVPLIDTGQMKQAIRYIIRKKGSGKE